MSEDYSILLTIDVEDWFQVENFKQCIPFSSWPSCELRVEKNTHRLLDLLDSIKLAESSKLKAQGEKGNYYAIELAKHRHHNQLHHAGKGHKIQKDTIEVPSAGGDLDFLPFIRKGRNKKKSSKSCESCLTTTSPKATFFILGWIAERLPHLVREIRIRGHEVASHGYYHNLCNQQSPDALKKDLTDSKKLLEDIIGAPVYGYRAPSFAINEDILKVIEDCGYLYDSSYNSFGMHGRYGQLDLSRNGARGIALQIQSAIQNPQPSNHYQLSAHHKDGGSLTSSNGHRTSSIEQQSSIVNLQSSIFFELPISNLKLGNRIFPWGGGGYFRLMPYPLFRMGVRSILRKQRAYLFYIHPWEVDPEQPKVNEAPAFYKFRHYTNLDKTHSKLLRLIQGFQHCLFLTCSQYIKEMKS